MRPRVLAFMGTPDFAVPTLEALIAAGHDIRRVYTQPPRPAGRGHRARPSPVEVVARAHGLALAHPTSLGDEAVQAAFAELELDAAVVVAYGLILPPAMLRAPRLGCLNLHASLLPRWRGAAPIQRAIMAGDKETGITTMAIDEGLDTGPMLLAERIGIAPLMTAGQLHDRLAEAGGALMLRTLAGLDAGDLVARPQPEIGATYAHKIDKAEARIEWTLAAKRLADRVRGLSPYPGAWFEFEDERIKLLLAEAVVGDGASGTVLDTGPRVACGEGALRLLRLQRAGKAALDAEAFLRGVALAPGSRLG